MSFSAISTAQQSARNSASQSGGGRGGGHPRSPQEIQRDTYGARRFLAFILAASILVIIFSVIYLLYAINQSPGDRDTTWMGFAGGAIVVSFFIILYYLFELWQGWTTVYKSGAIGTFGIAAGYVSQETAEKLREEWQKAVATATPEQKVKMITEVQPDTSIKNYFNL